MGLSIQQRRTQRLRALETINSIVRHPQFIKFVGVYRERFMLLHNFRKPRAPMGSNKGRWLYEYEQMYVKGQFEPRSLRAQYINILLNKSELEFHERQAVFEICTYAEIATTAYIAEKVIARYRIIVFTGEQAYDDDDDPYENLEYDEAHQICDALNEEAEEELFKVKKQC